MGKSFHKQREGSTKEIDVITLKSIPVEQLPTLRNQWNQLMLKMQRPSIFCTWEWNTLWLKHFGDCYKSLILLTEQDQTPVAIFPLTISHRSFLSPKAIGRRIGFLGSSELHPDDVDVIGAPADVKNAMPIAWRYLAENPSGWDAMHLSHVCADNHLMSWLLRHFPDAKCSSVSVSPLISLRNGFDAYIGGFSRKHRYNLNRQRKRLRDAGVYFDPCTSNHAKLCTLHELFELHRLRKSEQGLKSTFLHPRAVAFHFDLLKALQDSQSLKLFALRRNGKALAVTYGFLYNGRFNYYQSGLDPGWINASAGTTLILEMVNYLCEEGCIEFDFLRGDEGYKKLWSNGQRLLYDFFIFSPSLFGLTLQRGEEFFSVFKNIGRHLNLISI